MVFKWNQHKLHIGRLIVIQFEDDWRKTLGVLFYFDKFSNLFTVSINICKYRKKYA